MGCVCCAVKGGGCLEGALCGGKGGGCVWEGMHVLLSRGGPGCLGQASSWPDAPPKVGFGDHLLREQRGKVVDSEDLITVQRKELRQNLTTACFGSVRSCVCAHGGTGCRQL